MEFTSNEVNHRGKALIGIKATGFPFGCLYHGVNTLTDSVGNAVVEVCLLYTSMSSPPFSGFAGDKAGQDTMAWYPDVCMVLIVSSYL